MRRINWTEAMLSRLAELYPVETTAHTAYMLQIGVTAVKEKARELGLEKLVKSRWLERAGHISRHFDNRSYAEMACDLGISRTTVSRMARKLELSRSKEMGYAMSSRVRREMVRRERRRAIFGLDPLTRLKVISHRAKTLPAESQGLHYRRTPEHTVLHRSHMPESPAGSQGCQTRTVFPAFSRKQHTIIQRHIAMQYGQIVFLLFVAMACYYAFLIFTDIRKAQAAQNAEKENNTEEEIDISDEARSFRPTRVSRDEEKKEDAADGKQEETPVGATSNFRRPGYREAIMTDGILVDDLIHEIDRLAETGTGDLGLVIYTCENAR